MRSASVCRHAGRRQPCSGGRRASPPAAWRIGAHATRLHGGKEGHSVTRGAQLLNARGLTVKEHLLVGALCDDGADGGGACHGCEGPSDACSVPAVGAGKMLTVCGC